MAEPQDYLKTLVLDKFIEIIEETIQEANELGIEGKIVTNVVVEQDENGEIGITLEYDDLPEQVDE